jgi:hypothetical protein
LLFVTAVTKGHESPGAAKSLREASQMNVNVGQTDRIIRIVAGLVLLSSVVLFDGGWRWIGLIGLVPLATGLARWCPAYTLFGMNTCGAKSA